MGGGGIAGLWIRARICKRLRRPRNRFCHAGNRFLASLKGLQIRALFLCISRCTLCKPCLVLTKKPNKKRRARKVPSILFGEAAFRQSCRQSYLSSPTHHSREVVSSAVRGRVHYCWNMKWQDFLRNSCGPKFIRVEGFNESLLLRKIFTSCFFFNYIPNLVFISFPDPV